MRLASLRAQGELRVHHCSASPHYVSCRHPNSDFALTHHISEWDRTGSIWEHYDDGGGHGLRSHPFTGWTALVLNVMSEKYSV